MKVIVKHIKERLGKHGKSTVSFHLGKLTDSQKNTLKKHFPDHKITKEYFGYWKFEPIKMTDESA